MLDELIKLPKELYPIILDFIPRSITAKLNKTYFLLYYQENIINKLDFNNYKKLDTYIRNLVRSGSVLPFSLLLESCWSKWGKMKTWTWKNLKFPCYLIYVQHLSIKYNQTNIRNLIDEKLKNHLSINKYKKIRRKNILWSN